MPLPINGETLRRWRLTLRLSQTEIGDMFGVNQRTVSKWELGRLQSEWFRAEFVRVLARFYKTSPEAMAAYWGVPVEDLAKLPADWSKAAE